MNGLAVGFFDGVHLGHQAILRNADVALTFRNHPLTVLAPDRAPQLVMGLADRLAAIGKPVTLLDFTHELAALPPEDFAARFLAGRKVFCGENWRFGCRGSGDADWLRRHGYDVEVVGYAEHDGERISSSRIRRCLAAGEVDAASAMLGRRFRVRGDVMRGKGVGTKLGYPTVNVRPPNSLALAHGVYAVEVCGKKAVANYGCAPTMGNRAWTAPIFEIHFPETLPNLPTQIGVEVLKFIRPERTFASFEELAGQIAVDVNVVMNLKS